MGRRKRKSQQKADDAQKAKKQRTDKINDGQQKQNQKGKKRNKQPKKGQGKQHDWTWVENCKEVVPKGGKVSAALTVILTRVELKDDHTHSSASKASSVTVTPDDGGKENSPLDNGSVGVPADEDGDNNKKEAENSSPCENNPEKITDDTEKEEGKNDGENEETGDKEKVPSDSTDEGSPPDVDGDKSEIENPSKNENKSKETAVTSKEGEEKDDEETSPAAANKTEIANTIVDNTQQPRTAADMPKMDESKNMGEDSSTPTKNQNKNNENQFIRVIRTSSAKGKLKFPFKYKKSFKPLPNGDCGDGIVNPHPKDEVPDKYWAQRKRLFSRFDDGIQLDKEGWYSVTPEAIADHLADRIAKIIKPEDEEAAESNPFACSPHERGLVVLDAFCGCGGNAISFAKHETISTVLCIDNDKSKLKMAAKNASVYGIPPEKLILVESDACFVIDKCYNNGRLVPTNIQPSQTTQSEVADEIFEGYKIGGIELLPEFIDAIFLSPPWGGMDYHKVGKRGYDISTCMKINTTMKNTIENQSADDTPVQECEDDTGDKSENGKLAVSAQINGEQLLAMAAKAAKDKRVIYFLPRNTDGVSLGRSALKAGYKGSIELEQNMLNGKLKTLTAYFGRKPRRSDSNVFRPPKNST